MRGSFVTLPAQLAPIGAYFGSVANFADRPSSLKLPATVSTDQQAMIEFKGSHFERAVIL